MESYMQLAGVMVCLMKIHHYTLVPVMPNIQAYVCVLKKLQTFISAAQKRN